MTHHWNFKEPCLCGALDCRACRGPDATYVCPVCGLDSDECEDPEGHREQDQDAADYAADIAMDARRDAEWEAAMEREEKRR